LSEDPKWKAGLLSSGLPLEFEAARLLASKGFRVDADFKYAWADTGFLNEYAVDLHARAWASSAEPRRVTGALELVLECRHTRPEISWLFLPDPNPRAESAVAAGRSIRSVDEFSLCCLDAAATAAFEAELPVCCKGLQIDPRMGGADDAEPRRGLTQLQCVLPRLMVECVLAHFGDRTDQNVPFLFCPILLTTAPLLVARPELGVEVVEQSSELRELAAEVPYLTMVTDYGPDFQSLCQKEFRRLERLERSDDLLMVETKRAALCHSQRELPVATIESLMAADPYRLQSLFTRFIVCTRPRLPDLVERIWQAAESALQSGKELQ
jgi:hypothetical protein